MTTNTTTIDEAAASEPRTLYWACPECMGEIRNGLDRRFGSPLVRHQELLVLTVTDDGETLFIHCERHCRLIAEVPLAKVRSGGDRLRERIAALRARIAA